MVRDQLSARLFFNASSTFFMVSFDSEPDFGVVKYATLVLRNLTRQARISADSKIWGGAQIHAKDCR